MFKSRIKDRYRKKINARFYQGDILKNIDFVIGEASRTTTMDEVHLKYAVILSQDCDIEQDIKNRDKKNDENDKYLRSLLVCPAFDLEDFAHGIHFVGWQMQKFNDKQIKKLKQNEEYKRFHYLSPSIEFFVPELVLDFKHFFTLPRDLLYKKRRNIYLSSLSELYREELSQRFSNYLSRIGLPELKQEKV